MKSNSNSSRLEQSKVGNVTKTTSDDYFADDEAFLDRSADDILENDGDQFFIQGENVTTWQLVGLYDDEGMLLPARQLKKEPPVFRVTSSDGSIAEFLVTRNLSKSLSDVFDEVYRGYYGVSARKKTDAQKFDNLHDAVIGWSKDHPFGLVLLVMVAAIILYSMVV